MDETAEWPAQLPVPGRGAHRSVEHGACVMEYAALLSGREHTDHPAAVHPLLAALCRRLNDAVGDDVRAETRAAGAGTDRDAHRRGRGTAGPASGAIVEVLRRAPGAPRVLRGRTGAPDGRTSRRTVRTTRLDPGAGGGTAVLDRPVGRRRSTGCRWPAWMLGPSSPRPFMQAGSLCSDRAMVELLEEMVHEVRAAQGLPPVATSGPARTAAPGVIDGIGGAGAD